MTTAPVLNDHSLKRSPLEPSGKTFRLYQGSPHPFGSTAESGGVNFSLYSSSATNVTLLIFDKPDDLNPLVEINLDNTNNRSFNIWHVFVEGVYCYHVWGRRDFVVHHVVTSLGSVPSQGDVQLSFG